MNKYDVVKTIGEGAYGVVLQCKNKETDELVAIKRFKESDEDELVRKTTLREVRILRLLKDEPYVVRLQEAFRRKGKLYLVFDYVGCNLLDVLEQHPQGLPTEDIRRMVFTMLLGIRACHASGVIHRDIKPENLLVHSDNTLRLCDFGFARIYTSDMNDLTDYVATRWYRSPELLLGTSDYGLPSDMWAVGCIMAELIDGQAIFPCETEVDQLFVIQKLLGNFTPQQVEIFKKNPRFDGYTLKDVKADSSSLDRKFGKKASKKALSLLKQMLVIDPAKRCTVDEALCHPFFDGLAEIYYPQLKAIINNPFASTPLPSSNAIARPGSAAYGVGPTANVPTAAATASNATASGKIPALARPPSSLGKGQQPIQRTGTPSDLPHHHHHHTHHDEDANAGGEHDGSAPLTGGGGRGASPWTTSNNANPSNSNTLATSMLPRPAGGMPAVGGGGGGAPSILPPARITSANRHAMLMTDAGGMPHSNRVTTPSSTTPNLTSTMYSGVGGGVGGVVGGGGVGSSMYPGGAGTSSSASNSIAHGTPSNAGSFTGRMSAGLQQLGKAPPSNLPRIDQPPPHGTGIAVGGGSSYYQPPAQQPFGHQQPQQHQPSAMYGGGGGGAGGVSSQAPPPSTYGSVLQQQQQPPSAMYGGARQGSAGAYGIGGGGGGLYVNGGHALPPRTGGGVYGATDAYKYQQQPPPPAVGSSTGANYNRPKMY